MGRWQDASTLGFGVMVEGVGCVVGMAMRLGGPVEEEDEGDGGEDVAMVVVLVLVLEDRGADADTSCWLDVFRVARGVGALCAVERSEGLETEDDFVFLAIIRFSLSNLIISANSAIAGTP